MLHLRDYSLRFNYFHRNVRLFFWLTFLQGVAQSLFNLVHNLYILNLGYTRDFLGTLESIPVFVTAALAVPLALLCVNLPLRKNLLITLALSAAACAGLAIFPSKPALIFFRFVSGFAGAFMAITSWPLMAKYSDEKDRNFVFSFQFAFAMLAGFIGNLIGGSLTGWAAGLLSGGIESATAYRVTMLTGTGIMAAAILPALYFNEPKNADRTPLKLSLSDIEPKKTLKVFLPQIIVAFGAGMIMPYLNIFFKTGFNLRISSLGFYMSLMPLSMAVGGFIGPWLVKKMGQVRAMIILQALSVPFLAMMGFSGLILPTLAAAFIRTMLMNASWPIYSVFMLSKFKKEFNPLASAMYSAAWSIAWALGAKISGTLQMDFGFTMSFLITIVCYCSATLLISRWFLHDDDKRTFGPVIMSKAME